MNHFISLTTAETMTGRYRQNREAILKTEYQQQNILPLSETFDRAAFDTLLAKTGCTGLRIYYGMNADYQIHAIIVAVNENNEDILPSSSMTATEEEDIVDNGNRCPELCPPQSPLNS